MALRVQILGSTRLARVAVPYLCERRGARVVAIDPGAEDEALPWFAPVRALARDYGATLGRAEADVVLDLDPDARPTRGEGPMLRVLAPIGARSPDVNRALLDGGAWAMALAAPDGRGAWATRPLESWVTGAAARNLDAPGPPTGLDAAAGAPTGIDAADVLDHAVTRALEALDDGWEAMLRGDTPAPLPHALIGGRFRAQEAFLIWEQPAERVVARVRACAGPWGGARTHAADTAIYVLDAEPIAAETPAGFDPGVVVAVGDALDVATGRGVVRVRRVRPGWRPPRLAAEWATEIGLGPGQQLG